MTTTALDPDSVNRWKSERRAAHERIDELERSATQPGGLTAQQVAEWRRLKTEVTLTLAEWVEGHIEAERRLDR